VALPRAGDAMSAALRRIAAALLLLVAAASVHAPPPCEAHPPDVLTVQPAMTLASHVAQALDASGAQVAAIGRIGQDLSPYGRRSSHLGALYRDSGARRA